MHRGVVVGAGFGGLAAARELAGRAVDATLVDQRNFHTLRLCSTNWLPLDSTRGMSPVRSELSLRASPTSTFHSPIVCLKCSRQPLRGTGCRSACLSAPQLGQRSAASPVAKITPSEVELKAGSAVASRTVIWAGGVTVNGTAASGLGTPSLRNGRLVAGSDLTVPGHESVFAIGDAAAVPVNLGSDQVCPQPAQVAIKSGRHDQVIAQVSGQPLVPLRYRDKGIMATTGRRACRCPASGWLRPSRDAQLAVLVRLPQWRTRNGRPASVVRGAGR